MTTDRYIVIFRNPHLDPWVIVGASGPWPDEDVAREQARKTPLGAEFELAPLIIDTGIARVGGVLVDAKPYEAQLCPTCDTWIYTAAHPFAEDDPTKPLRDYLHHEREHMDPDDRDASRVGFPFFRYNTEPVRAVLEEVES
jgi:hypothetical protein